MPRKETDVIVDADNRDAGKVFHITEMSAGETEEWAERFIFALLKASPDAAANFDMAQGAASVAAAGLKMLPLINYDDVKPLLDQMFKSITVVPDAEKPHIRRALIASDTEEISTRLQLRAAWFGLHFDFSQAAVKSALTGVMAAMQENPQPGPQMFRKPSR